MSEFTDFNELYEPLVLPINGKQYTIPPVSFAAGVRINVIINARENGTSDLVDKMGDEEFFELILGSALDEMLADGVPMNAIDRAGRAVLADFRVGRSMAEVMWKTGGDPKAIQALAAPKPNRAARRSKGTAVASKTP